MANNVEHFYAIIWYQYILFDEAPVQMFVHSKIELFIFWLISSEGSLYILDQKFSIRYMILKYFLCGA